MMLQKSRNGAKSIMVVLDGFKVSKEKNGRHAPLLWALHDAGLVEKDEVLVLAVFNSQEQTTSPVTGSVCCLLRENKTCQSPAVDHLKLLQEEINSKIQTFTDIFKAYHEECKTNGVSLNILECDNFCNYCDSRWHVQYSCFMYICVCVCKPCNRQL